MIRKISAIIVFLGIIVTAFVSSLTSQPSFNGPTPGCSCHTFQAGILSTNLPGGLAVEITLSGATSNVAGELVDSTGTVVAVNDLTSSNPFTLIAPHEGRYTVNAGYKSPSRVWDSTQVEIVLTAVGDDPRGIPATYQLGQNYPNPFNPTTSIDYSIPVQGHVTLKVFDLNGRVVATLVDGFEVPGVRTVTFDASGLASGVYLYQLRAGDHFEMKHLVVLR